MGRIEQALEDVPSKAEVQVIISKALKDNKVITADTLEHHVDEILEKRKFITESKMKLAIAEFMPNRIIRFGQIASAFSAIIVLLGALAFFGAKINKIFPQETKQELKK